MKRVGKNNGTMVNIQSSALCDLDVADIKAMIMNLFDDLDALSLPVWYADI